MFIFFLCQFTEFHSTVLWATFYLFMILHLLEALCLVTEGWLSYQLQRRTFWFGAMARWTQQVTFHFLHSKEIFVSLTWHRWFMERILEAGDSNPESTFAVRHPNPPFVSWKSGLKDGEGFKRKGIQTPSFILQDIPLNLDLFLIREQEEGWNNETNLLNKIQNHNRLVNSTLFTRLLTSKKWDSNSRL